MRGRRLRAAVAGVAVLLAALCGRPRALKTTVTLKGANERLIAADIFGYSSGTGVY